MFPFGNKIKYKSVYKLPYSNIIRTFISYFILLRIFHIVSYFESIKHRSGFSLTCRVKTRPALAGFHFDCLLGLIALLATSAVWANENTQPIRFGLTPAIIHNQYELLTDWREYLQKKLKHPVVFVSRDSYRETIDLIKQKKIDFAWVSTYPYVYLEDKNLARLLVTPLYQGRPYYCSYLIVPASDLETKSLLQLKGKIFAFADPYSTSGYLVPRYQLQQAGENPNRFFRKTFFTWGHRRIVEAVAQGLADAGSLDSFVWDTLAVIQPDLTRQTRIVAKSPEYGFPPIVARLSVNRADSAALQQVLLGMANDPEGAKLLKRLNLSGFAPGDAKLYNGVRKMMRAMAEP